VDRAGDHFEAAWEAGHKPAIEDYLSGAAEPERSALLHELLLLEIGYRRRSGETPVSADYLGRFADHTAVVRNVFDKEAAEVDGRGVQAADGPVTPRQPGSDAASVVPIDFRRLVKFLEGIGKIPRASQFLPLSNEDNYHL
jgi:hypothetical protein